VAENSDPIVKNLQKSKIVMACNIIFMQHRIDDVCMLAFCVQRNIGVCADLFCARHSVKWCLTFGDRRPESLREIDSVGATQAANRRVVVHCTTPAESNAVAPSRYL
jgi:hypothetical protein